jgi:hypothetical protein
MSSSEDALRSALRQARARHDAVIFFITGSIADSGSTAPTRQPVLAAAQELAGVAQRRGWLRLCKHPFDFSGSDGEYQIGSGGEWRLVRGGQLAKTDPNRRGRPTSWQEPTPWDALSAGEHLVVEDISEARLFGTACTRYRGHAYQSDQVTNTPAIWESDVALNVAVLIDGQSSLRQIEIRCLDRRTANWRGTSLYVEFQDR